jgi:hypothetical protein
MESFADLPRGAGDVDRHSAFAHELETAQETALKRTDPKGFSFCGRLSLSFSAVRIRG